jgi:hypothetical protein
MMTDPNRPAPLVPAPFVIAVDGASAAGKGMLARRVAAHFNLAYLDTGLLYRAVAARLLRAGIDHPDESAAIAAARAVSAGDLDLPELRAAGPAADVRRGPPGRTVGTGRRRGARWAGYRHRRLAASPGEAVHPGRPGTARPAAA